MEDWVTVPYNSNKLNQTYFQNFIDVSGVMSVRNSNNINLYAQGSIPDFSINSHQIRVKDNENYYDISNSKLRFIQTLYENVQDRLDDLISRTQYISTSQSDEIAIFQSSIEISNNLLCLSDLSLSGNLFIENESIFNGRVDICGNLYANYSNNSIPISAITNLEYNINTKSNLISPEFTGIPTAPTADPGTNTTQIATTEFVTYAISGMSNQSTLDASLNLKANLESPTFTGTVSGITKSMVGLGNVDNTSDTSKPVSTAQQAALDLKASIVYVDASLNYKADINYVDTTISNLVNSAPETLNTLNELAYALGDDANFSTTITNSIATKAPINNPTFTGTVSGITKSMVGLGNVDNTSDISKPVSTIQQNALDLKADLASPTFTGTPITPTAAAGTNTTQIATTAFVVNAVNDIAIDLTQDISVNTLTIGIGSGDISTNSVFGYQVLSSNTTGFSNVANGYETLLNNTTGFGNVANGSNALYSNTTGAANVAIGRNALYSNTTANSNIAVGDAALYKNTTGFGNVSTGSVTLYNNTTGSYNTAHGYLALYTNTYGSYNTANGSYALRGNYGYYNSADGYRALYYNTSGGRNTATGYYAGYDNTAGSYNTFIGANTNISPTNASFSYSTALGYGTLITESNQIVLGRSSETVVVPGAMTISGIPTAPTAVSGTNTTQIATTEFVADAVSMKADLASPTFTGTVSGITNSMVGLGNVDNTSDASKPVSTAQQIALDLKADLASPTFTGTVSGITNSMVGLGNVDNTSDTSKPVSTAQQTALDLKANLESPTFTGTVSGITNSMVGLGNVDNTSDASKPVSTAQQTALDLKANLESPTFTGTPNAPTATSGTNTTQIATTAFVTDAVSDVAIDLTQDITVNSITVGRGSGSGNTVFGYNALGNNTTGNENVATGGAALYYNTTGGNNTATGYEALYSNTTGGNNVANGHQALYSNAGWNNTAVGHKALYSNTTGNEVTAIGRNAGYNNTTAQNSYNTFIGYYTDISPTNATWTNSTALGSNAKITASNQIVLGNTSISSINCQVQTITSLSDARDKKNIQPLTNGIAFVDKLNPVKFDWNMRDGGKVDIPEMGFIAQDLQQVQEEIGIVVPGLVSDSNPDRLEASYGTLIPILVKAIQDLSEQVTELKTTNATLQSQLNSIMTIITNNNLS